MMKVVLPLVLAVLGTAMGQEASIFERKLGQSFPLRTIARQNTDAIDGFIILGADGTTLSGLDLPSYDDSSDSAQDASTIAYEMCETLPKGTTVTCQVNSCTVPDSVTPQMIFLIVEARSGEPNTKSSIFSSCADMPSASRTFTEDAKGVFIMLQENNAGETVTDVEFQCFTENFEPTITDLGSCDTFTDDFCGCPFLNFFGISLN